MYYNLKIKHSSFNNMMWIIETSFEVNVAPVIMPCRHRVEDDFYDELGNTREISQ
jgi:hypothetical protein